ncbi:LytR/AlgR family response regulator transcription factor [Kordia jejudonensis]|uniref:LytR/AlgR family response regulator transcription factor n=1 Tax=Kordia jejudonensis TaxID=1348245 RepID=UPI0006290C9B|nr:LytTR family DNA-binding domain-containing protein [Kordia jejudonensis]
MVQKVKCFIIENDPIALFWLQDALKGFIDIEICGFATNYEDALEGIKTLEIDLLLSDIELDNCTSFDVLESLESPPNFGIIFITSHEHYALQAIKVNAIDYITKPVTLKSLRIAINTFISNQQEKLDQLKKLLSYLDKNKTKKRIALPMKEYTELVNLEDIMYFKADVNYCIIYIKDIKPIIVSKTLKEFDLYLKDNFEFIRIHQSYLINKNYIKKIIKTKLPQVIMQDNVVLNVSRSKKTDFLKQVLD